MNAIKQDGPYDSRTLTKWFAVSSILLAVVTVWMVLDDYTRSWKTTQDRFRKIEIKRAEADVDEAKRALAQPASTKEAQDLKDELKKAQDELDQHGSDRKAAETELTKSQATLEKANLTYSIKKSYVDSYTYFTEEARASHEISKFTEYDALLKHANEELDAAGAAKEQAEIGVKAAKARLDGREAKVTDATKKIEGLTAKLANVEHSLYKIAPSLVNVIRDAPGLDFFDPAKRVRQRVLPNLKDDYYFAMVRKVDRCETCHLAIDRKDFNGKFVHVAGRGVIAVADATAATNGNGYDLTFHDGHKEFVDRASVVGDPVPIEPVFQSHPDLDTYLTSSSPHPVEKFGCTVCHMGEGQSISFVTAAHTPNFEEERHEWYKHHKWDVREHWNEPQFPKRYIQASCLLCHPNNRHVPGADKLNFGRETWERLSCVGCHKMRGYEDEAKRGPDLRRIEKKLTKKWVAYWVENPQRFRPKTNMPRFFHMDVPTAEEKEAIKKVLDPKTGKPVYDLDVREKVEVRAITEFLFARSAEFSKDEEARGEAFTLPAWKKGDAARGKVLFTARGCVGCHKIDKLDDGALRTYAPDEFGPNLYNLGHKVKPEWVQTWVMNPKHYWAETRMPNLRILEDDARDLATYLTEGEGVKDAALPDFQELGSLGEDEKNQLWRACQDYLEKDFTSEDIKKIQDGTDPQKPKLNSEAAQLLYLGEQTIGRAGCFGCHFVKGMESRPGIGRELSDIGDKNLTQVDWGFESVKRDAENKPAGKIRETRHEWLQLKV